MKIKPYHLKLKKLSRHEYEVLESLKKLSGYGSPIKSIPSVLADEISNIINRRVEIEKISWREKDFLNFADTVSVNSLSIIISMPPIPNPLFLVIDRTFLLRAIDASLGGDGSEYNNRPLSETELGILDYLIAKLLVAVKSTFSKPVFSFHLENIIDDPKLLKQYASSRDSVVEMVYKLSYEGYESLIKFVFPDPVVNQILASTESQFGLSNSDMANFKKHIKRYGYIETPILAEIGNSEVESSDIDKLEPGDVILLDESTVVLNKGKIKGNAKIRIGKILIDQKSEINVGKNTVSCKIKF